jgi:hypothetical protein
MYSCFGVIALMLSATAYLPWSRSIHSSHKEIGVEKFWVLPWQYHADHQHRIFRDTFACSIVGSLMSYFAADLVDGWHLEILSPTTIQAFSVSITIMFIVSASVVRLQVFTAPL